MNTQQTFDITKCKRNADGHLVAQYRGGEPAVILTTTRPVSGFPIVSMRPSGLVAFHKLDGSWFQEEHDLDLINIPEKHTIEFWALVRDERILAVSDVAINFNGYVENFNGFRSPHHPRIHRRRRTMTPENINNLTAAMFVLGIVAIGAWVYLKKP